MSKPYLSVTFSCVAANRNAVIAGGYNTGGKAYVRTSLDNGLTFGNSWADSISGNIRAISHNGNVAQSATLFIGVGNSNSIYYSSNATSWTRVAVGSGLTFYAVASNQIPGGGVFVAGADNNALYSSTDGVTWTSRTSAFAAGSTIASICWSEALSLFVAVGYNGTTGLIQTSPDGIAWTNRVNNGPGKLVSVAADDYDSSAVYALGEVSANSYLSTNGTSWTASAGGGWSSAKNIVYAAGIFIVDGKYTSPDDGASWYLINSAFTIANVISQSASADRLFCVTSDIQPTIIYRSGPTG